MKLINELTQGLDFKVAVVNLTNCDIPKVYKDVRELFNFLDLQFEARDLKCVR